VGKNLRRKEYCRTTLKGKVLAGRRGEVVNGVSSKSYGSSVGEDYGDLKLTHLLTIGRKNILDEGEFGRAGLGQRKTSDFRANEFKSELL